jgi:hypothetical protein
MRGNYMHVFLYYILLGFIISLLALLIRSKSFEPIKIVTLTIVIAIILYIVDLSANYTGFHKSSYKLGLSNM